MRTIQKKVCLLGDIAVGKTSLIRRYVEGRFDDKYLSTIGVNISRKVLERENVTLNLLIWDLAGGEDFKHLSDRYLLGAVGALVVCDLTRPDTLPIVKDYIEEMHKVYAGAAVVLAGNKVDLEDQRVITDDELEAAGRSTNSPCLLTSAKTGQSVEDAFLLLAKQIEANS